MDEITLSCLSYFNIKYSSSNSCFIQTFDEQSRMNIAVVCGRAIAQAVSR
jgi:hypothetical protein